MYSDAKGEPIPTLANIFLSTNIFNNLTNKIQNNA